MPIYVLLYQFTYMVPHLPSPFQRLPFSTYLSDSRRQQTQRNTQKLASGHGGFVFDSVGILGIISMLHNIWPTLQYLYMYTQKQYKQQKNIAAMARLSFCFGPVARWRKRRSMLRNGEPIANQAESRGNVAQWLLPNAFSFLGGVKSRFARNFSMQSWIFGPAKKREV